MNTEQPPFARTVCACTDCVSACKRRPAHLIPADVAPILAAAAELGQHDVLVASPGALVGRVVDGRMVLARIGTISPKSDATGRCTFLTDDDRCAIHAVAPFGCAIFDYHQSKAEGDARSLWGLERIADDPDYAEFRATLPLAIDPQSRKRWGR